ncbi:MAG: glycerol-3-phosphate dehydrogenase/oxidase [Acidimicrobiia bacterium]
MAAFDRPAALTRLAAEEFDVLVVGGGITGAGVALDAASRGLRAALVERDDFASGTSSKSSKLVHGGLRYLQQREFGLVYENLRERHVILRNAPHLVRVMPFLVPIFTRGGMVNRKIARAFGSAMWLYDLTGGIRIGKVHKRISADEVVEHMPTLSRERVAYGYVYYDAQADDARLTLAICRTAADHGAAIANYARVTGFLRDGGRVNGARVEADGTTFDVRARVVVNAAGVWADEVRTLDEGADPHSLVPAKGIHITVPWSKVRNDIAGIMPVPKDGRGIFVVPWGDFTYIGTTDTEYHGSLDDPQCTHDDVQYLLDAMNASLREPLADGDVLATWAGLRPLVRGARSERTADLSRRHSVTTSASGVVTVTGGKLTTYRKMAADAVDAVARTIGSNARSRTKHLPLHGATTSQHDAPEHLARRYGAEKPAVMALAEADPSLRDLLVPGLPYLEAEAVFAVRREMARTLDDVLSRRTRARLLARDASADAAAAVAALLAPELGWTDTERDGQVAGYRASVEQERTAADLPETALDSSAGA